MQHLATLEQPAGNNMLISEVYRSTIWQVVRLSRHIPAVQPHHDPLQRCKAQRLKLAKSRTCFLPVGLLCARDDVQCYACQQNQLNFSIMESMSSIAHLAIVTPARQSVKSGLL